MTILLTAFCIAVVALLALLLFTQGRIRHSMGLVGIIYRLVIVALQIFILVSGFIAVTFVPAKTFKQFFSSVDDVVTTVMIGFVSIVGVIATIMLFWLACDSIARWIKFNGLKVLHNSIRPEKDREYALSYMRDAIGAIEKKDLPNEEKTRRNIILHEALELLENAVSFDQFLNGVASLKDDETALIILNAVATQNLDNPQKILNRLRSANVLVTE